MEIRYRAFWTSKNGSGGIGMTHGVLTEEDLVGAVLRKEDRKTISNIPVELDSVDWDSVDTKGVRQ
jgi:hypothetical protein